MTDLDVLTLSFPQGFGIRILPSYLDSLSLPAQNLQRQNQEEAMQCDTLPSIRPICIESVMRDAASFIAKRTRGQVVQLRRLATWLNTVLNM